MSQQVGNIEPLLAIMQKLRDPDTGCAWDKAQTFQTIVPFTLEEAYEVADTIERLALDELPDELGDLLFQVVFYCQLGKEQGMFDFDTVVKRICDKLTRRHPHVFATLAHTSSAQIKQNWEEIKGAERAARELHSALDDIPLNLPSLSRAMKVQKRVARVGFDWPDLPPVFDKVYEEIEEVRVEVNQEQVDQRKVNEEVGDLLFAVVNLARHLGVEPETALRQANQKFEKRFRGVETCVQQDGRSFDKHTLVELDAYWDKVKLQTSDK